MLRRTCGKSGFFFSGRLYLLGVGWIVVGLHSRLAGKGSFCLPSIGGGCDGQGRNPSPLAPRQSSRGQALPHRFVFSLAYCSAVRAQEYRAPSNLERLVQRLPSLYAEDHAPMPQSAKVRCKCFPFVR